LDEDQLCKNSLEAQYSLLNVAERNNIYLGQRFHDLYQSLQDRILPEPDLDELNDSNSFLSMAINSAVKNLEHSEGIDTDFFLHNDPFRPPVSSVQDQSGHSGGMMGPPPPPPPPPPPTSVMSTPSSSTLHSGITGVTASSSKMERMNDKFKDSFELDIVEQLINEQQQSEPYKTKYSSSVKRYDPKYRALTEAIRFGNMDHQDDQKLDPATPQQQQQQQQQQQHHK